MKPLELAYQYMDIVFSQGELDELWNILDQHLKFRGPFFQFDNADDYINQ